MTWRRCSRESAQAPWRERPFERPFLNVVSLIAKVRHFPEQLLPSGSDMLNPQFPWYQPELWNDGQRNEFFDCAYGESSSFVLDWGTRRYNFSLIFSCDQHRDSQLEEGATIQPHRREALGHD